MARSVAVAKALLDFYAARSVGEAREVADHISTGDDVLVIGTSGSDWIEGRTAWLAAIEIASASGPSPPITPGPELRGYEEGRIGWAVDRPSLNLHAGVSVPLRVSAIFRLEMASWRLVSFHASVGVPDEILDELIRSAS
jgi:hypothetical protein